jgi:hypothetical protein
MATPEEIPALRRVSQLPPSNARVLTRKPVRSANDERNPPPLGSAPEEPVELKSAPSGSYTSTTARTTARQSRRTCT